MNGNALEVALGLMRLPAMRGSLRRRPLPEGVGELIELAAAVPKRVEEASVLSGEPPQLVLEAARFYVREVLLFQGADAYRVLGVEDSASAARIKVHYRRLQHWLHPDRRGNDWESAFAVRINKAWGELRSPARRAAYDARRAQALAGQFDGAAHRVLVNDWRAVPEDGRPWGKWLLLAAVLAGCVGLMLLLVLKGEVPVPEWDVQAEATAQAQQRTQAAARVALDKIQARQRDTDIAPASQLAPAKDQTLLDAMPLPAAPDAWIEPDIAKPPSSSAEVPRAQRPSTPQRAATGAAAAAAAAGSDISPAPGRTAAAGPQTTDNASTPAATPSVDRLLMAQRRGEEVTSYLGSRSGQAPPIWHSLTALDEAAELRERLKDGHLRLFRRVRFEEPQWRIGGETARMTAGIRRGGGAPSGVLQVDMVWRDGMWLVEHVEAGGL